MADGWKLGTMLHDMLAKKDITARHITLPMENAAKADYLHALMERMERELAPSIQAMFAETLADPDAPESVRAVIHATAYPEHQFDAILGLATAVLGIFSIAGAIASVEVEAYIHHLQAKLLPTPNSPQEAALAVIKGVWPRSYATSEASLSGIDPRRFDMLVDITGEPPAIQELLFLWRRGKINTDRLVHGVQQSRVRDEWVDAIEELAYAPPSAQEAIQAAVQNHLDPAAARQVVAENGIDPAAFDWLLATAGRPPGIQEMIQLWHRGAVSQADVEQAVRESDIKDKYIPAIIAAAIYVPPVRSVVAMLRAGAIDAGRARQLFAENGVRPQDADGYIAEATKAKSATHRELTEGSILAAYRDRMIGRTDAQARLVALDYDAATASFLLDLADAHAADVLQRQQIATTRSKFVGRHVTAGVASAALDSAHVPADQRDQLLALWTVERDEDVRQLTPALLVKGVKANVIDLPTFHTRLVDLGYSDADATLLAQIEGLVPVGGA